MKLRWAPNCWVTWCSSCTSVSHIPSESQKVLPNIGFLNASLRASVFNIYNHQAIQVWMTIYVASYMCLQLSENLATKTLTKKFVQTFIWFLLKTNVVGDSGGLSCTDTHGAMSRWVGKKEWCLICPPWIFNQVPSAMHHLHTLVLSQQWILQKICMTNTMGRSCGWTMLLLLFLSWFL